MLERTAFWFIDAAGLTCGIDDAMLDALAQPRHAVMGRSPAAFIEDASQWQRSMAEGQAFHGELRLRPGHGGDACVTHWQVDTSLQHDQQGQSIGQAMAWRRLNMPAADARLLPTFETYARTLNAITDMVSVVGDDSVYRLANDAWYATVGLRPSQVVGRHTEDIFPDGWIDENRARAFHACLATGQPQHVQDTRRFEDGGVRSIESTYFAFGLDQTGRRCVVVVSRDVTDRMRQQQGLASSARLLHHTLQATGDAIFASDALDPDEPVRFANRQLFDMWALDPAQAQDLTPRQILAQAAKLFLRPEAELERVSQIIRDNLSCEDRVELRDGRVLLRRCTADQLVGQLHPVRVWSFRDITLEARARQAAEAHEQEMRTLLESFPSYIAVLDEQLNYTFANERFATLLRREPSRIIGRNVDEVLGAERGHEVHRLAAQALADGLAVFEREVDGRLIQVTMVASIERHVGKPRYFGFGMDVTDVRQTERAKLAAAEQIRALLDAFPGFIVASDKSLRYTYVNERYAAIVGKTPGQMIGRRVADVLGQQRHDGVQASVARLAHASRFVEERHLPADAFHTDLDIEVNHVLGAPDADGHSLYYAFGLDITQRKRAEEALQAARLEAELANQAKSQFLSHMSHELRTPLNAVHGFAQLMREDPDAPLTDRQQQQLGEILSGAGHLLALINDVLDLGRIETGKLPLQSVRVDMLPLLRDCVALVQALAAQRAVSLPSLEDDSLDVQVQGDPMRVKQVMLNLLGNAIKYNREGGEVRLRSVVLPGLMRLEIQDTGGGLSPAQVARLFQPFERLHGAGAGIEGTGIGLALSRQLMSAMGGRIGASSVQGVGSSFWIELPLHDAPAFERPAPTPRREVLASRAAQPAAAAAADAQRVLYIEDNPVNVMLMQAMLERLPGLEVRCESHPTDGLETARRWRPQLVLLDIQLPGMSGFDVLRHLRDDERTRDVPVVAVSANAMPSDIAAGLKAGFRDYLTKPVDLRRLSAVVREALSASAAASPSSSQSSASP